MICRQNQRRCQEKWLDHHHPDRDVGESLRFVDGQIENYRPRFSRCYGPIWSWTGTRGFCILLFRLVFISVIQRQQHGSVYWKKGSRQVLQNLDSTKFLFEQLANCFSVQDSPVWMDSSTSLECESLENKLGGPQVNRYISFQLFL